MAHAVFLKGRIGSDRYDEAVKTLKENIVPMVKGAPGFVSGAWFGDTSTGHGLVIFDTQEQAQQMASTAKSSDPEGAMQIDTATVYEVHAQA